ncbi:hypothetical protein TNCV_3835681 [Trichonephila clavipes]|nr:hypothetical protein TNCV_3835681 [Trichonephila clavipes]
MYEIRTDCGKDLNAGLLDAAGVAGSTGIGKGTTFVMARLKIPVEVFTLTTLTRPSLPGNTSRIRPIGQSGAWCWDPLKERADSPSG